MSEGQEFVFDVSSAVIDQTPVTTFQTAYSPGIEDSFIPQPSYLFQYNNENISNENIYSCFGNGNLINNWIYFLSSLNDIPNVNTTPSIGINYLSKGFFQINLFGSFNQTQVNVYPYYSNSSLGGWVWSPSYEGQSYFIQHQGSSGNQTSETITIQPCNTPPEDTTKLTNISYPSPSVVYTVKLDYYGGQPQWTYNYKLFFFFTDIISLNSKKTSSQLNNIFNFSIDVGESSSYLYIYYQSIIGMVHSCYLCSSFNSQSNPSVAIQNQATEIFLNSALLYDFYVNNLS